MAKYPESLDGNPPVKKKRGLWRFLTRVLPGFAFSLLVAFLAVAVLWRYVVITHDDRYLDELHLPARRIRMEEGRIVELRTMGG